jgi:hypothetical protein
MLYLTAAYSICLSLKLSWIATALSMVTYYLRWLLCFSPHPLTIYDRISGPKPI